MKRTYPGMRLLGVLGNQHRGRKLSSLLLFLCLGGLLLSLIAAAAQSPQPVETAVYLTGAASWRLTTDEQRALYLKAGFHLIYYDRQYADWAAANDLRFIGTVAGQGLPPEANRPFEASDGVKYSIVGRFTPVNFNAPSVVDWWRLHVPQAVRDMPAADRVAFWKVHNEFGYHSDKIFDYSDGTIAVYRKWLQERYRSIEELNRRWQTSYAGFDAIDPPRTDLMKQLPNWLEWRRFTSWNFGDYFKTTGDLVRSVVPGARVSDNFYIISPLQGWDLFELSRQTEYLALDLYSIGRWMTLYQSLDMGRSAGAAYGKPFVMMEYHAGPNDWGPVVRGRDLAIEANVALARESRAIMWYMWRPGPAGIEQGIHGMLDMEGRPTERYTVAAEVSALTARLAPLLLNSHTQSDVAIVTSADSDYLSYAQGKPQERQRLPWSNLGHVLDAARIQWDFVDVPMLLTADLRHYKAIILGHIPVLGDDVLNRLGEYVEAGGTVVTHPDVALLDDLGHARGNVEFEEGGQSNGLWTVRTRRVNGPEVVTTDSGKGRRVSCAWQLPDQLGAPDEVAKQAASYAGMLEKTAGVEPALAVDNVPAPAELDARRLESGKVTLLFLTNSGKEAMRNITVTLPRLRARSDAILFDRALGSPTRIPVSPAGDGVRFSVPQVDPAVIVLLGGPWQPIVGIDAPKSLHPGDEVVANVTVDNFDAVAVSGEARLRGSAGWKITPAGQTNFAKLAPGKRATVAFRVTVPADAAVDRFALDNPLIAEVSFSSGRTGVLSVRHLPFVEPPLDVILTYHDQILNPWQELTPPILRWGWDREVHIPPPPPIPVKAAGEAVVEVSNSPALAGRELSLAVAGPGEARVEAEKGAKLILSDKPQSIPVRFQLAKPGPYRLTVVAGDRHASANFIGGVDEDTARVTLAERQITAPPGWQPLRLIAVGAREAPAYGQPITVKMTLPEQQAGRAAVFAAGEGNEVPVASSISASSVTFAADVPKDGVSTYVLAVAPEGTEVPQAARIHAESGGGRVIVRGDNYAVTFNRELAQVESIEVAGNRSCPGRTISWQSLPGASGGGPVTRPGAPR